MQTVEVPISILTEMEKHIRKFFWNELTGMSKMHFLKWESICRPKLHGGLGFKNLRKLNLAFLVKLGWMMLIDKHKLWVQLMWAKYGSPIEERVRSKASKTWRGIYHAAVILRQ